MSFGEVGAAREQPLQLLKIFIDVSYLDTVVCEVIHTFSTARAVFVIRTNSLLWGFCLFASSAL